MEFKEIKNVNIETIGSLSQSTRPCPIKYKSMKAQHQQVKLDRRQILTTALSVHGTTVIHQGGLVNDISSS
jgi:hypothetical protein